jgi:iron complex outermembrane recepter protein
MRVLKTSLLTATALTAFSWTAPALAQDTNEASEARLGTITVTAQRREEDLQAVPIAVTVFTPEQLEAAQIEESGDLVRFVPGMAGGLNTGTGSAVSFYIRGLGSTEQVATFDVPVAFYVDEIYIARQSVNNVSLFDVERAEVLRGPQGTLFGRNATGGAVSITMRKPGEEFGGYAEASYGSFNRTMARASVDLPLNPNFRTKFSAFVVNDDGYSEAVTLNKDVNGEESWGVRAAASIDISETLTWDVSYDYIDASRTTLGSLAYDPDYLVRSGLQQGDCDGDVIGEYLNSLKGNCSRITTGGLTSNLAWETGLGTVNFITGYRTTEQKFALDFQVGGGITGSAGGFMIANDIEHTQLTQEVKLVGSTDNIDYVAGVFYLKEDATTDALDIFGLAPVGLTALVLGHKELENETDSLAAYAQGDFGTSGPLVLTLGLRLTQEEKSVGFSDLTQAYPAGFIPSTGAVGVRPTTANMIANGIPTSQEVTKLSPRLALTYIVSDDLLVYASATNGFKSGGWNARNNSVLTNTPFGPETANSFELGMKSTMMGGNLRFNLTAYALQVSDLQVLAGFNTPGGGIAFVTQNAADFSAHGIEFETAYAPTDNFQMFFNGSVSDGGEYSGVPPRLGAGGVPCTNNPEPANCTTSRDTPVRYPELQLNIGGIYTIPLANGGEFNLNGAVSYQSEIWTSSYNDTPTSTGIPFGGTTPITAPLSFWGDTTIVNVGANYVAPNERWVASLECSNCTEEYYLTSTLAGTGYANDPRRVTLRVRYNF